ncbi:MAG TPA: MBL fold metallo-hydrolase, partial [Gemmatimonadaceae bacterium]|nr:MBL fold metallo-hydrolase [Gemmatimonadaceae bacterium]
TLIEAGPASTTPVLLSGIRSAGFDPADITRLIVTHIHLDHAGASGLLLRHFPRAKVFVHPKGAKHLIDPSKLIASAERIYGDQMQTLWGDIVPVPEDRVVIAEDQDMIGSLKAIDTPGHAVHHHSYYDASTGTVFTGDVAGVRIDTTRYVRPPTPPPELDLDAWAKSIERLRRLEPRRLALTHFGEYEDIAWHLDDLQSRLNTWRDWLSADCSARTLEEHEAGLLSPELAARYERVGTYQACVDGFARYFAKR